MTDNQNWLAEYVQTGSDAAFRELVTRYVDLVYSIALRLVDGDAHRAEDVAQTVFLNLARVARTLPKDVKLGGWLHRDTCFTASTLMRGERRRQTREKEAAEMNALQNTAEADYSFIAPVLDEAINELGEDDRTAILLRFFEQQDFRSVGQALSSNEDAARMRVTRALEKLESFLKRRGITTTTASLGVVLSANAVQAAPVGLALTISAAAALTGTTLTTAATITATKAIAMTTLQKTIVTATIAVLAGAGIYEARQASQLREQNQALQQQQVPMAEQIQQLQQERDETTRQLAILRDDNERLNRNTAELLKLRNEVAQSKAATVQRQADPTELAMKSWLSRVNQLKESLGQMPDKRIPELQFLTETDWLETVRNATVDTEIEVRQALNALRNVGKDKVASAMHTAIRKYTRANNGEFPTAISQLRSYFDSPLSDDILERYEILPAADVTNTGLIKHGAKWLRAEKARVDVDYDTRFVIGEVGHSRTDFDADIMIPVVRAFQTANSGQQLGEPSQLLPFVQTPDQQRALQKWIQRFPSLQK